MNLNPKLRFSAIIPAAGCGQRFGDELPKQYHRLDERAVLEHSMAKLLALPGLDTLCVVLAENDPFWSSLTLSTHSKVITAIGGDTRVASVMAGLQALQTHAAASDWTLIHDAVRPLVAAAQIRHMIDACCSHPVGGVLAMPVADTLKQVNPELEVVTTIDREGIWQIQTPQFFRTEILRKGMALVKQRPALLPRMTDEAAVIEALGLPIKVVPNAGINFKITTRQDLQLAQAYLNLSRTNQVWVTA